MQCNAHNTTDSMVSQIYDPMKSSSPDEGLHRYKENNEASKLRPTELTVILYTSPNISASLPSDGQHRVE